MQTNSDQITTVKRVLRAGNSTKLEEKDKLGLSMRFMAIEIAASSISNIFGTIIGHPLDTIRVSMPS